VQVFLYCERGLDPGLWAEPVNAATNIAFVMAAVCARRRIAGQAGQIPRDKCNTLVAMCGLVALVGVGSFTFHTLAVPAAQAFDVVPIGIFIVSAFWLTLRWIGAWPQRHAGLALLGFMIATASVTLLMTNFGCSPGSVSAPGSLWPCLNGSWAYGPAFGALAVGTRLAQRHAPASAVWLMAASGLFCVAFAARSLDWVWCRPAFGLSLHALWHLGCAATAYAVLRALTEAAGQAGRLMRPKGTDLRL
jgi:hypothetical protein